MRRNPRKIESATDFVSEDDYREVISNFNRVFDNDDFIISHEAALEMRSQRLDAEYEEGLAQNQ